MKKVIFTGSALFKNMVLVTGTHCSGKSMISPIVASLEKVEPLRKISFIDQILILRYLKQISKTTAIFLIKNILDTSFLDQILGRNLNFRLEDETSIFNSKNTNQLFLRIFKKKNLKKIKDLLKKKIFILDSHNGVWFNQIWLELKINNFKIIDIHRNPIFIVSSWIKRDYGRMEKKDLNQLPMLKKGNQIMPSYFYKLKNNYKNLRPVDRIIDMVSVSIENEINNSKKIKNKILRIEFDEFAKNTNFYIKKICKYLNTDKTKFTKEVMKKENLPRKIHVKEYYKKKDIIKSMASEKYFTKLLKLEKKYLKSFN